MDIQLDTSKKDHPEKKPNTLKAKLGQFVKSFSGSGSAQKTKLKRKKVELSHFDYIRMALRQNEREERDRVALYESTKRLSKVKRSQEEASSPSGDYHYKMLSAKKFDSKSGKKTSNNK